MLQRYRRTDGVIDKYLKASVVGEVEGRAYRIVSYRIVSGSAIRVSIGQVS